MHTQFSKRLLTLFLSLLMVFGTITFGTLSVGAATIPSVCPESNATTDDVLPATTDTDTGAYAVTLNCPTSEGGTASLSCTTADAGETVSISVSLNFGYEAKISVYRTDNTTQSVTVTDNSFVMPAYDATVEITFVKRYEAFSYVNYTEPYADCIGAGGTMYWAVKIPSATLIEKNYQTISGITCYYKNEGHARGTYTYKVREGSPSDGVILASGSRTFTANDPTGYYNLIFDESAEIDQTKDLWITFYAAGMSYPAAGVYNSGLTHDINGEYVSLDGTTYEPLRNYGLAYTFMIAGLFDVKEDFPIEPPAVLSKAFDGLWLTGEAVYSVKEGTTVVYETKTPSAESYTKCDGIPSIKNVGVLCVRATAYNDDYAITTIEYTLTITEDEEDTGITVYAPMYGTVSVTPKYAKAGNTVTITTHADAGYTVGSIQVQLRNGKQVALDVVRVGEQYTFRMPKSAVSVFVRYDKANNAGFADVAADAFYYDSVTWAVKHNIASGVDATHFAPEAIATRAQFVTYLWRAAGCPTASQPVSFSDVAVNSTYAQAVAWAVENGITMGVGDGKFAPDMQVTRAQIVSFLYRYAKVNPVDADNVFADVAADAYYYDAVLWASANGITCGTSDTTFSPDAMCTTSQVITFLYRLMQ